MLIGSEGILGVITEAWVRVQERPEFRASAGVEFEDFAAGAEAARALAQSGLHPSNCRLLDEGEAALTGASSSGKAVLVLGFESADHPLDAWMARALELCADHGGVASDPGRGEGRRRGLLAQRLPPGALPARHDGGGRGAGGDVRDVDHLGPASATSCDRCARPRRAALGEGRVTCRLTHVYPDGAAPYFTVLAPARRGSELEQWQEVKDAAGEAIIAAGGTITHHHAVGRDHRPWYDRQRPEPFAAALRAAKRELDPARPPESRRADRPVSPRKRELARADRVLPGVWRLRLPLPWPGVPHVNAYAIAAGSGVVLVDTGMHEPGSLAQLELALDQAGLSLEHVRLLVCTHAHSDHYGQAGPIVEASGCELWMHPNHEHMTRAAEDPDRQLERRIEVALHSGVPAEAMERYREARKGAGIGIAEVVKPHRDLLPGVEVETDLGTWQVYETPGHAPTHVVLHQPDRRLLLSGDHITRPRLALLRLRLHARPAGRVPVQPRRGRAELDTDLVLAGHGRPVRDLPGLVEANRTAVHERIGRVRDALAASRSRPSRSCRS